MHYPFTSIILGMLIFFTVIYPAKRVGFEFIPNSDRSAINVSIDLPDGSPIDKTIEVVKKVEAQIETFSEVENILSDIGYDGEEKARITVDLVHFSMRDRSDKEIMNALLPKIALIPEADISLSGDSNGAVAQGDITIDIRGESYEDMIAVSEKMKNIMIETGNFSSIKNSYRIPKMELRFSPNPESLIKQDVYNNNVGAVIRALVNGNDDAIYKEGGEEYDINITLAKDYKTSVESFDNFLIKGKDGLIPISSLGQVEYVEAASPIKRRDKERIIQLNGFLAKGVSGEVMAKLTEKFTAAEFPETTNYRFAGRAENSSEAGAELGKAFLLAVILTYLLLVAILDSFFLPISIGSSILTSFLGVFVLMFFLDFTLNVASMMAMVMVVGLAVNNAILLIEYAEQQIAKGVATSEALWQASKLKLKPIIMTSLAIIFGTLPQVFDINAAKASMGAVVIGGMLGSMFFTYMMVPAVHQLLYNIKGGFSKYFKGTTSLGDDEDINKLSLS